MVNDAFCAMCGSPSGNSRLCPRHKSCSPAEQLRHHLANARNGAVGFEKAWDAAWCRLAWPHDTTHRREWKATLEESRGLWECSYEGIGERRLRVVPAPLVVQAFVIDDVLLDSLVVAA